MTNKEKRLERLKNNPKDVTFNELVAVLKSYGFEVRNYSGGSHYTVTHEHGDVFDPMEPNSIPRHKPHILPVYVRRAVKWIERVAADQEADDDQES
jgi:hypothetical protein